jgi:hypothetical protein
MFKEVHSATAVYVGYSLSVVGVTLWHWGM